MKTEEQMILDKDSDRAALSQDMEQVAELEEDYVDLKIQKMN